MAYSTTLNIKPITLVDLTVTSFNSGNIVDERTLEDFEIVGDALQGSIRVLATSDTITISSTGYKTVTTYYDGDGINITLSPLEFSNIENNSIKYYCKDLQARESINNISTDLNNKADNDLSNLTATGKSLISDIALPSDSYVDLTAGASGTIYTMPSVGWLCIGFQHPDNSDWVNYGVDILDSSEQFIWNIQGTRALNNQTDGVVVPVARNQKVRIFQNSYIINRLRFIYAQGSESEAN